MLVRSKITPLLSPQASASRYKPLLRQNGGLGKYARSIWACCYMSHVSAMVNWSFILCYQSSIMLTLVFTFSEYAVVLLLVVVSVQRTRWHRKSPGATQRLNAKSPHTSLHTENPYKALPFLDFSPATTDFKCIWPYTTKGTRCRNSLNAEKAGRQWANTLRNTIADDSPYSELAQAMLGEYAQLCLCHRHRPETPTSQITIDDWVQQWLTELRALHNSLCGEPGEGGGAVGKGILLFAQTTVPEPTSEEDPAASNTPQKCETSDPFTPFKDVPGSFPRDDIFDNLDMSARRSSTPGTLSAGNYSETVRNSPLGVERLSPKRTSSATPKLSSARTTKFELYSNKLKRTLLSVLNNPLGPDESTPGYVYIFTRRSDEDLHSIYVKIGVTRNVEDRLVEWRTKCRYKPHLEYKTARIPNAMRVEALVHMELIESRRIERKCSGCKTDHDEWFETNVETARPFVERWAQWMQEADPYTKEGQLSSHIVKKMFERKLSKDHLTSEKLLSIMSDNVAAQPAPQSPLESPERRATVALVGFLDPASPTSRKSALTADLINNLDVEDSLEPERNRSPSAGQVQMPSGLKGSNLDVIKTWRRTSLVKDALEQASSATRAECEEVKVKLEPEHDLYDPLVYDKEASDSQASYHDAESFPEHSPATAAAKEELDASLTAQPQTTGGPFGTLEVPACGD
jgi:hypothetical protein